MVDEFMSCDRLFGGSAEGAQARSARHLLEAIPCDMRKQSFCADKGSSYPESAIWRFKEENRALMRRLYGDMDSPTLYREMRSTAEKSSNNFQPSKNNNHKLHEKTKSKQSRSSPMLLPHIARSPDGAAGSSLFSALDYNIRIGSGLATVQGAKDNILSGRLATRLGGGRLKIKKKEKPNHHVMFNSKTTSSTSIPEDSSASTVVMKEETSNKDTEEYPTTTVSISTTSTVSSVTVQASTSEAPTIQPTTLSQSTTDGEATETTNMIYPTTTMDSDNMFTTDTVPMITDYTTLDGSATSQGEIVETEFPSMESRDGSLEDGLIKDSSTSSKVFEDVTTQQNEEENVEETTELDQSITAVCSILQKMLEKAGMTRSCEEILKTMADTDRLQLFETKKMPTPEPLKEQQNDEELDYVDDSIYEGSSTSACPVRREVVSPYWANNTRQQTLALLNIYPFEQYVHMEMCKYEHHEMLCRPGCKCEQQYRMHRLLAFDPSNECRGIFSDWFELPSFCVCKCYESITENFIPRPRRPRIDLGPETPEALVDVQNEKSSMPNKTIDENQNTHKHETDGRSFQNIPAILPYEAKLALLKEIRHRDNRNLLKSLEVVNSAIVDTKPTKYDNTDKKSTEQEKTAGDLKDNHQKIDSRNEAKKSKSKYQEKQNKGNFLYNLRYGNLPVMEFKLPDGSSGTVDKVPRR